MLTLVVSLILSITFCGLDILGLIDFSPLLSLNCMIILFISLLITPVIYNITHHKQLNIFSPLVFFTFIVFIGHVLPIPSYLSGIDPFLISWHYDYISFESSIKKALLLSIYGVLGYYIGSVLPSISITRQKSDGLLFKRKALLYLGLIYTLVGITLFAFGVILIGGPNMLFQGLADRTRAFAGFNYFFSGPGLLMTIALVWWMYLLKNNSIKMISFWVFLLLSILLYSFSGSKASVFMYVLAGIIAYHYLYKRLSVGFLIVGSIIGTLLMTFFDLIVREIIPSGGLFVFSPESLYLRDYNTLFGNFSQIQVLTALVDAMPNQIEFKHGSTFLFLLVAPIPSSLWPGKLDFALTSAGVFTNALWPYKWQDYGTTMPPSLMGELYMNFGFSGSFIGMLILGVFYKYLYSNFINNKNNPISAVLFVTAMAMIPHYIRGEFSSPTVAMLMLVLPSIVALWIVTKKQNIKSRVIVSQQTLTN